MKAERLAAAALLALTLAACTGEGTGPVQRVHVRPGASFAEVADSLEAKGIVRAVPLFRLYARIQGDARHIKPGTYGFKREAGWDNVLADLRAGRILNARLVIPEGWDTRKIGAAVAEITELPLDTVMAALLDTAQPARLGVPGPTLEGYLYPATYTFPVSPPLDTVITRLVARYKEAWTPARESAAAAIGLSQREVVTLASIIEWEAKKPEEMPLISAVYHNRLRIGYPLQADPTVQYALGEHQRRLLYAHIDSVADHPYNTYRRQGLPPGPIGSPSDRALDAALDPADTTFLYFVARADGSHVFTNSLEEHNRAKASIRRAANSASPPVPVPAGPVLPDSAAR